MQLYYIAFSPPCRAISLVAGLLDITDIEIKNVNLLEGEQFKPEFLEINPEHTVPVLVDGETVITDSRAINMYLVNKYGKDDTYYPKDPSKRAAVDNMLFFEQRLFLRLRDFVGGFKSGVNKTKLELIYTALGELELYLERRQFVAGESLTIADASFLAIISTFYAAKLTFDKFPKILEWLERVKPLFPNYGLVNGSVVEKFKDFLHEKLGEDAFVLKPEAAQ